jgi:hypothetical protein
MLFLLCAEVVGVAALAMFVRRSVIAFAGDDSLRLRISIAVFAIVAALAGFPVVIGVMALMNYDARPHSFNWVPVTSLLGGLLAATAFVLLARNLIRRERFAGRRLPVRFGLAVFVIMASMFLVATSVDHFRFFRGRSGVVFIEGLSVSDVPCDRVVVRLDDGFAQYRCPRDELVFGSWLSDFPFVPWPYMSGTSRQLFQVVRELNAKENGSHTPER